MRLNDQAIEPPGRWLPADKAASSGKETRCEYCEYSVFCGSIDWEDVTAPTARTIICGDAGAVAAHSCLRPMTT